MLTFFTDKHLAKDGVSSCDEVRVYTIHGRLELFTEHAFQRLRPCFRRRNLNLKRLAHRKTFWWGALRFELTVPHPHENGRGSARHPRINVTVGAPMRPPFRCLDNAKSCPSCLLVYDCFPWPGVSEGGAKKLIFWGDHPFVIFFVLFVVKSHDVHRYAQRRTRGAKIELNIDHPQEPPKQRRLKCL